MGNLDGRNPSRMDQMLKKQNLEIIIRLKRYTWQTVVANKH